MATNRPTNQGLAGPLPEYRITVAGALDSTWIQRTRGLSLEVFEHGDSGPTTQLSGFLDSAGLMGILQQLFAYGALLLSVEYVPPE